MVSFAKGNYWHPWPAVQSLSSNIRRGEGSDRQVNVSPTILHSMSEGLLGFDTMKPSALRAIGGVLELVIAPMCEEVHESSSRNAPYLMATLECYAAAMKHLDKLARRYGLLSKVGKIDMAWYKVMDEVDSDHIDDIKGSLIGNQGIDMKESTGEEGEVFPDSEDTKALPVKAAPSSEVSAAEPVEQTQPPAAKTVVAANMRGVADSAYRTNTIPEDNTPYTPPKPPKPKVIRRKEPETAKAASKVTPRKLATRAPNGRLVPVIDVYGSVILMLNGSAYMVPEDELPVGVIHARDTYGNPSFAQDGNPVLLDAEGVPANQHVPPNVAPTARNVATNQMVPQYNPYPPQPGMYQQPQHNANVAPVARNMAPQMQHPQPMQYPQAPHNAAMNHMQPQQQYSAPTYSPPNWRR